MIFLCYKWIYLFFKWVLIIYTHLMKLEDRWWTKFALANKKEKYCGIEESTV